MAPRQRLPSSDHLPVEPASRVRFRKATEVTHLKATCFLAHLSVYILMDSLPCVLVSQSHFDGKPQQWLRQRDH